jgi:hypothetical protein
MLAPLTFRAPLETGLRRLPVNPPLEDAAKTPDPYSPLSQLAGAAWPAWRAAGRALALRAERSAGQLVYTRL